MVRPAAQAVELDPRLGKVARLVEQFVIKGKNLVGTDDDGMGMPGAYGFSLGPRQGTCNSGRGLRRPGSKTALYGCFIDIGRDDTELDPRIFKHAPAVRTCRGQEQRRDGAAEPSPVSCCSAAVAS